MLNKLERSVDLQARDGDINTSQGHEAVCQHIAIDCRSWQRQNNPILVLSETGDESSLLPAAAAAAAAAAAHGASCFDANGTSSH